MTQITTVQLRELVPKVDLIAVLINPTFPVSAAQLRDAQEAAAAVGVRTMACRPKMSASPPSRLLSRSAPTR
jgi:hypothetical protein